MRRNTDNNKARILTSDICDIANNSINMLNETTKNFTKYDPKINLQWKEYTEKIKDACNVIATTKTMVIVPYSYNLEIIESIQTTCKIFCYTIQQHEHFLEEAKFWAKEMKQCYPALFENLPDLMELVGEVDNYESGMS